MKLFSFFLLLTFLLSSTFCRADTEWWNDPSALSDGDLRYQILESGSGTQRPTRSDRVTVHYAGELTDGTPFDSSYSRGEPTTFGVTQVIPGWTQILQKMTIGDKWKVWIPSKLAYGSRAVESIPPNSDLIFTIALIQIPTQRTPKPKTGKSGQDL